MRGSAWTERFSLQGGATMRNHVGVLVLVLGSTLATVESVAAQPGFLVKDIRPGEAEFGRASVWSRQGVMLGGFVYLVAVDELHGVELWRSDGTPEGTELFLDLCPGLCDSVPSRLQVVGDTLWFTARTGQLGREIWLSDGTREGSRLLRDICSGPCDSVTSLGDPFFVGPTGEIFFTAQDGRHGYELWKSDGTWDGTVQVADLSPGRRLSYPSGFTLLDGHVYFSALGSLWQTDGSATGTFRLAPLCGGSEICSALILGTQGGCLVTGPSSDRSTYRLPGPIAEREVLRAIDPLTGDDLPMKSGSTLLGGPAKMIKLADGLFGAVHLLAAVAADGRPGIWRSDLSPGGPVLLRELASVPTGFVVVEDRAFFIVPQDLLEDELWVSDGTATGTRRLARLDLLLYTAGALSGRLLFTASDGELGRELWVSDGTPEGTRQLLDLEPGGPGSQPVIVASLDPWLFFSSSAQSLSGLWRTDGTEGGAELVKPFEAYRASSLPRELTAWEDRLFFNAWTTNSSTELWITDGTAGGTSAWLDPARPRFARSPRSFTVFDDDLYFVGSDPEANRLGLLRVEESGDPEHPEIISIDGEYESARSPLAVGDRLFFLASPRGKECCSDYCRDLFVLEAGQRVARLVKELNDKKGSERYFEDSHATQLTAWRDRLLFVADDGEHGQELWISDGSNPGTGLVADLCDGACSASVTSAHPFDEWVLLGAGTAAGTFPVGPQFSRGSHSFCPRPTPPSSLVPRRLSAPFPAGLWRTDGSPGGTQRLATFSGVVRELHELNGRILFVTRSLDGDRLWASDGTREGTLLVSELSLQTSPAWVGDQRVVGDLLFLSVFNPATGLELWISDGTADGTRLLSDLWPGPRGSSPHAFAEVDDRLVFAATDGSRGVELWVTDGTPEGTIQVQDIAPGRASSSPMSFVPAGDLLFFTANDGQHGRELWALPRNALAAAPSRTP